MSDRSAGSHTTATPTWWEALDTGLREAGAALVGSADVEDTIGSHTWHTVEVHLREWLDRGHHANMEWMERPDAIAMRVDPRTRYPWIRSAIAAAFPYNTLPDPAASISLGEGLTLHGTGRAKISRYAHGVDYHWHLGKALERLVKRINREHAELGLTLRYYLDTGPVLERQWAERAGLGWLAKNSLLINPRLGSWFFLAVIFSSHEPPPSAMHLPGVPDRCGSCTRCLDACPTDALALDGSGVLDANRCISYLTIEARDEFAPPLLADHHEGWWLGCDICQQVCPWNRKAPIAETAAFQPLPDYAELTPDRFAALTEDAFRERFRKTPLWRPRHDKLVATLDLLHARRP